MSIIKKGIIATTLAASALTATAPAMARDYYRHHDNTAAVAVGVGILGLAIGAIAASDHNDRYYRDDRYRNDGYYYRNDGYNRNGNYHRNDGYDRSDRRYRDGDHYRWNDDSYYRRRGY